MIREPFAKAIFGALKPNDYRITLYLGVMPAACEDDAAGDVIAEGSAVSKPTSDGWQVSLTVVRDAWLVDALGRDVPAYFRISESAQDGGRCVMQALAGGPNGGAPLRISSPDVDKTNVITGNLRLFLSDC